MGDRVQLRSGCQQGLGQDAPHLVLILAGLLQHLVKGKTCTLKTGRQSCLTLFFCVSAFNLRTTYEGKKNRCWLTASLTLFSRISLLFFLYFLKYFPYFLRFSLTQIHKTYLRIDLKSFPQTAIQLINHLPASFHGDRVICS